MSVSSLNKVPATHSQHTSFPSNLQRQKRSISLSNIENSLSFISYSQGEQTPDEEQISFCKKTYNWFLYYRNQFLEAGARFFRDTGRVIANCALSLTFFLPSLLLKDGEEDEVEMQPDTGIQVQNILSETAPVSNKIPEEVFDSFKRKEISLGNLFRKGELTWAQAEEIERMMFLTLEKEETKLCDFIKVDRHTEEILYTYKNAVKEETKKLRVTCINDLMKETEKDQDILDEQNAPYAERLLLENKMTLLEEIRFEVRKLRDKEGG